MKSKERKDLKQMTEKELKNVNGGMNVVGWGGSGGGGGSEVSRWAKAWKAVVDMMY